jgi:hypothetical protein
MTTTAKLFKNGRSQAVRLPREFRFEGDLRGVNYYCRLATTISAGEGSAKECWSRPDRTR